MRHLVLGTAGHIDHGKSAIVRALTGVDPDRLKEEQRRGITIELGFADLELSPERVISFVDVPGHERFVRHMVAGATGIDAVLVVIAADQGVQPQTREHLDICSLLDLRRGVVALSKCDLVDDELQQVSALEVRELLEGTFLETAPLIPVSARDGHGLDALRCALLELFDQVPARPDDGVARLPVDRAFVLKGFGTVVTGTLVGGRLQEGDEVEILPGGKRGRIRGLQVHHHAVPVAAAGQRTAVNLQGLDCADVPRGSTVTHPGALTTTRRIWARLALLPDAPERLQRGGRVRLHQGTCDRAARYRILDRGEDGSMHVELHLEDETVLAHGDRFILRRPAPVDTVGGGIVVDAQPPRARDARAECFIDESLAPAVVLGLRLQRAGAPGRDPAELAQELGLAVDVLAAAALELEREDRLVRAAGRWVDGATWRELAARAVAHVSEFHRAEPLRAGISREELRGLICREMPREHWRQLLESIASEGKLALQGERVSSAGHRVELTGKDLDLSRSIERDFREAGLDPPDLAALVADRDRKSAGRIIDLLLDEGKLERIHDGRLFSAEALQELRGRLREYAKTSPTIDVAGFKALAGVTRKNAIPLLEHLDAERTTRRKGNLREIL